MSKTLLTPSQAAALVGVTRPGFIKIYERGEIEAEVVAGRQTFFTLRSINALKARRNRSRKAAKKR